MHLTSYLNRIGFSGEPRADLPTLRRIHRLHLAAIPYENLDVQLGRTLGLEVDAHYRKLVEAKRGGWCYEMNGLMGWALEQIGFRVMRLAGGVRRDTGGDVVVGSHLVLAIALDQPYLADVGFGDGMVEPAPIVAGAFRQDAFEFRFERLDDSWWRFHNHPYGGAPTFDFELKEAPRERLQIRCEWLQTSSESGFVQNAVCQRYVDGELRILRGRVLKIVRAPHVEQRTVDSLADYRAVLADLFALDIAEVEILWHKASARHLEWLRAQAQA